MLWKFFKPQLLLDTLFDEGWCGLGVPEAAEAQNVLLVDLLLN